MLVLDEPTSGLDPAQRREIRDLLMELAAGERTVILSTHVLSEVEDVCERVVIISHGQIVAQDSIEDLRAGANRIHLQLARPSDEAIHALSAVEGVNAVHTGELGGYELAVTGEVREAVAAAAVPFGLLGLSQERLEDIYLRLTQGARS